ncbi:hypothetical protein DSM112329_02820 [Paraconexibacter sp. AEG42_29]|uniref:Uncharacterized protein n=1 Tax=Paraconexibacter sp. AEG42_29 TaxID=2997339 RepID=A0AAU7AW86_9ACTN
MRLTVQHMLHERLTLPAREARHRAAELEQFLGLHRQCKRAVTAGRRVLVKRRLRPAGTPQLVKAAVTHDGMKPRTQGQVMVHRTRIVQHEPMGAHERLLHHVLGVRVTDHAPRVRAKLNCVPGVQRGKRVGVTGPMPPGKLRVAARRNIAAIAGRRAPARGQRRAADRARLKPCPGRRHIGPGGASRADEIWHQRTSGARHRICDTRGEYG